MSNVSPQKSHQSLARPQWTRYTSQVMEVICKGGKNIYKDILEGSTTLKHLVQHQISRTKNIFNQQTFFLSPSYSVFLQEVLQPSYVCSS